MTKETTNKVLGASSYKNSKKKKKLQQKQAIAVKKLITKDRQIKVKIKHLEKELERISKIENDGDKKLAAEKTAIEKKIKQLNVINKKFEKKK
jgi:hypothetical protein